MEQQSHLADLPKAPNGMATWASPNDLNASFIWQEAWSQII